MFLTVSSVSLAGPHDLLDLYAQALVEQAKRILTETAPEMDTAELELIAFEMTCRYEQDEGLARDALDIAGQQARFDLGRDSDIHGEDLLRALGHLYNVESRARQALEACQRALTPAAYAPTA